MSAEALEHMMERMTEFESVSWVTPDAFVQWREANLQAQGSADTSMVFHRPIADGE